MIVFRWMYELSYSIPYGVYLFTLITSLVYFVISRPPTKLKITRFSFYGILGLLTSLSFMPIVILMTKITGGKEDQVIWQEPFIGFGSLALLFTLIKSHPHPKSQVEQAGA